MAPSTVTAPCANDVARAIDQRARADGRETGISIRAAERDRARGGLGYLTVPPSTALAEPLRTSKPAVLVSVLVPVPVMLPPLARIMMPTLSL